MKPGNRVIYVAIAVLLLMSFGVQVVRDRGWQPYQPENSLLWVRSGRVASKLSLGFTNLVADVYWMRAVIYYGGKHRAGPAPNYDLLYPLLDLVTSLDPQFRIAYRFGAIFLTEGYPNGPGRPDQAMQLLQRGIDRDSGRWMYYHDAGFINYWWLHDIPKAAEWFNRAADRPGAPEWLKPMAAVMLAEGGSRDSSRRMWHELQQSDVDYIRNSAGLRLLQLDAMDLIDAVTPALKHFRDREGRLPASWEELAAAEHLPGVPRDPTGVPLVVNPAGKVDVSTKSTLWPLPGEPGVGPAR